MKIGSVKRTATYMSDFTVIKDGRAARYNEGKPALSYILTFPAALIGFARVCMYGEKKYKKYNYLKGAQQSQYADCLLRHLNAHWRGEEVDPESGCRHVDHIVWNALALSEFADDESLDDRPEMT